MKFLKIKHKPSIALAIIYGVLALGAIQTFDLFGFELFTVQTVLIWAPVVVSLASVFFPRFLYILLFYWCVSLVDFQSGWISFGFNPAYEINLYLTFMKTFKIKMDIISLLNIILMRFLIIKTDI